MFWFSCNFFIFFQRYNLTNLRLIVCFLITFGMGGSTWWKSLLITKIFPPNGSKLSNISTKILSMISIVFLLVIDALSYIMSFAYRINSVVVFCFDIAHVVDSLAWSKILNIERTVLPFVNIDDIPKVTIISAIIL